MYSKQCKYCSKSFEHKDKRQKYCSKECYFFFLKENPNFKGQKHSLETINLLRKKCGRSGEKNPFYGKNHSLATRNQLSLSHKRYFKEHKQEFYENQLKQKNLTIDILEDTFIKLKTSFLTITAIAKELELDKRTLANYWVYFKICSREELKDILLQKKMVPAKENSTENIIYDILVKEFGTENIKRQFKLSKYYYDFLLYDNFLVEYDSYYWHVVIPSKNDKIKTILAENLGYTLYRIVENSDRSIDYTAELNIIRNKVNEIKRNKNN